MQSSNAPNKISLPFAASGTKNTIPVPSQQGVTPGAASFTDGFPPLTFTPLSAGGVPPAGADFNGILNSITALQQWKSAGGQFPFDATFAAAIGGYPKGATVLKADGTGLWISTAENNTTNPDTGGAGWLAFSASAVQSGSYNYALDVGSTNAYAIALTPAPTAFTDGMRVHMLPASANTGACTLNVNGLGAIPIIPNTYGASLTGGEIKPTTTVELVYSSAVGSWLITIPNGACISAPATGPSQSVILSQFASSKSNNGYLSLPNGIIFQWGKSPSIGPSSSAAVTFPIAFPTAALAAYVTANTGTSGSGALALGVRNPNAVNVLIDNYYTNDLSGFWLVIGY